jgi:hypothetical protein
MQLLLFFRRESRLGVRYCVLIFVKYINIKDLTLYLPSGRDPQRLEELMQGGLCNLFRSPNALTQESSEAAERSAQERMGKGLDHGGGVDFFAQLDETDDKGGEDFERMS